LGNQRLPLYSQENNRKFSKLQSLLEAKKWWLQIEKQSLAGQQLGQSVLSEPLRDGMWRRSSF